jgi:hypothetical protein
MDLPIDSFIQLFIDASLHSSFDGFFLEHPLLINLLVHRVDRRSYVVLKQLKIHNSV